MLDCPRALLLDFGGVIAEAPRVRVPSPELVELLCELAGAVVTRQTITEALIAGDRAYAAWRDRSSRAEWPLEVTHAQFWDEFVTSEWPARVRAVVRREASVLCYHWAHRPGWVVRPGVALALETASQAGVSAAVVSNTLCGAAHRDFLERSGLAGRFAAQVYSDEAGIRKPNPELAIRAADLLNVSAVNGWFIGDSWSRDIACARRAGMGAAVLMRSPRTARELHPEHLTADAVVDDGFGLDALLKSALHAT